MSEKKCSFDQKAADWDKNPNRVALAQAVSSAIASSLPDKKLSAMEYGCGTGLVGLRLAPQLEQLLAVDTSAGMLDIISEKVIHEGLDNVTTLQCDLQEDSMDQQFELIFTSMSLHHVEKSEQLLEQLVKQLQPNGLLAIADLDEEDGSFHQNDSPNHHHNGFNRKDLTQDLRNLGMKGVSFQTIHTIVKKDISGKKQPFTVFLMTAQKA